MWKPTSEYAAVRLRKRENKKFYCIGGKKVFWSADIENSRRVRIMGKSLKKKTNILKQTSKHLLDSGNNDSI